MATINPRFLFLFACLMFPGFEVAASGGSLNAQAPEQALEVQCDGTLGTIRTGMTIEVKQETITGGHYFTAKDLLDVPITGGAVHAGRITISAADGSAFDLRFKSNDGEHSEHLGFDNSVGLAGTRHNHDRVEKVDLGFLTMGQPSEGRRYAYATDRSDAEFELIVRKWRAAVLTGNRKEAAHHTHFPLRVNAKRRHSLIHTPAELSEQWNFIFAPGYLSRIKKDLPHDMLGEGSMVMLGAGDVWFDDKGIAVLNLPD